MLGAPYPLVLRNSLVSDRTLRLWISRFNQQGIDGLIYLPRPGRPRLLDGETVRGEILPVLDDPSKAGQHHRTAVVFFGDEAGFEGDPRPRHKWVRRGSRPTQGYYGGHVRRNVVGAVEPATGRLVSLIVAHCNTEVFQAFLDTMAEEIPAEPGKQVHLVIDNAGWHKSAGLNWHHIKPFYLSPYSPDFNPIERLSQHLKGNAMAGYLTKDGEALTDQLLASLQAVLNNTKLVRSVCSPPRLNRQCILAQGLTAIVHESSRT